MKQKPSGINEKRHSEKDYELYQEIEANFKQCDISLIDKLEAFPRFISKRSMARFLVKNEIYKKIINISGVVVEGGVFNGAGLFTWAQLANIYEPVNYNRQIIGFDTFEGFPHVSKEDDNLWENSQKGDLKGDKLDSFQKSIIKYNLERHLSHIENVNLIKGDFLLTAENFLKENKHILIALLYLDFDLYEPTKKALELFLPRMSKGAIVCFDELNCKNFPGETMALLETVNLKKYKIERSPIDPWISFIRL